MVMRRVLKWAVAVGLIGAGLLAAPVMWLHVDDAAVPPEPDLPADVTVLSRDVVCGSNSCHRELVLVGSAGQSGLELVSALGLQVGSQDCRPRSLIDRRSACRYVGSVDGNEVHLGAYYDRNGART